MASKDQVVALARAHYEGDGPAFRRALLQIASHARNAEAREELQKLAAVHGEMRVVEVPHAARAVLRPLAPIAAGALVLDAAIEQELHQIVRELRFRTGLLGRGIRPRSRVLLHGPPGNGKTSAGRMLATMLGVAGFGLVLPAIIKSHMGETGAMLSIALDVLRAGAFLQIDELDALGGERIGDGSAAGREKDSIVSVMLTVLDSVDAGVLVGTTNRIEIVDPAIRRRFDIELELPRPTPALCRELGRRLSRSWGVGDIDLELVAAAESFDGAARIVERAAREHALAELEKEAEQNGRGRSTSSASAGDALEHRGSAAP